MCRLQNYAFPYLSAEVLQWVALDSVDAEDGAGLHGSKATGEEELLAAALLLDDLDQTRLQLLNGWHVVCQDTHVAGFRWEVDLDAVRCISSVFALDSRIVGPSVVNVHIL